MENEVLSHQIKVRRTCDLCGKPIPHSGKASKAKHFLSEHPELKFSYNDKGLRCTVCEKSVGSFATLVAWHNHDSKIAIETPAQPVQYPPTAIDATKVKGKTAIILDDLLALSTVEELGLLLLNGFTSRISQLESALTVIAGQLRNEISNTKQILADRDKFIEHLKDTNQKLMDKYNTGKAKEKVGSLTVDTIRHKLIPHPEHGRQ